MMLYGIIPLLFADLSLATSTTVTCTDMSEWGYGAVTKTLDTQAVLHAVQVSDRWRFSRKSEHVVCQTQEYLEHVGDSDCLCNS